MIDLNAEQVAADARGALGAAQRWARELGHGFIGTEHLLWGAVEASRAVEQAASLAGLSLPAYADSVRQIFAENDWQPFVSQRDALAGVGIDAEQVRRAAEAQLGPGAPAMDFGPPFTPRSATALERALGRARADGRDQVSARDLAASALGDRGGVAALAVLRSGSSVDAVLAGLP